MRPDMTDNDFALLSQYLDGELDELSTRRVEQRLGSEPALRETLQELATLDQQIQQAFLASGAVPAHVAEMLRPAPARKANSGRRIWGYAAAASVAAVAGLIATLQVPQPGNSGPTIAEVLEITPSSAEVWHPLSDGKRIRPILSFRDVDGAWCREFLLDNHGEGSRGVACRDAGKWETRIAVSADLPGSQYDYRPASSSDVDAVADYTARRADGIALSAGEESKLIAADWQEADR